MRKAVFFLLFFVLVVASAKDYSITNAELTYTINPNGIVHVKERITYSLHGCFRELYLEKPTDLVIKNARGYCENARCTFRIDEPHYSVSGYRELILSLNSGGCDNTVTAVFDYDIYTIKLYNDTAQFYYKLWGDQWEKSAPLKVRIILPGDAKHTTYYIHSFSDFQNSSKGNSILISAHQPSQSYLEINLLMPLEWFEGRGADIYYYDYNFLRADIIQIEERQASEQRFWKSLECFFFLFSAALVLLPFIIVYGVYVFFGREYTPATVGYFGEYEREPPSKNPPAEAPFFIEGEFSENSLPASIMHLIYMGYLDIVEDRTKNDLLLVPGRKKEPASEMRKYEKTLLDYIRSKMENGKLSMKKFKNSVASSYGFYEWFNRWRDDVINTVDIEKYMEKKGYNILIALFGVLFVINIVAFFLSLFIGELSIFALDSSTFLLLASIFSSVIIFIIGAVVGTKRVWLGRWTKEGRLLNLRWSNFKKYLGDFTLLKEHPPSSVKLWDYYMSYAVAFGVAEETLKAMKVSVPAKELHTSRLYPLYSRPVYFSAMRSYFVPSYSPPSRSSGGSGSIGGFGGGFGGGGGGAR